MSPREELVRDYLNRLSDAARGRLTSQEASALIDRTRSFIERKTRFSGPSTTLVGPPTTIEVGKVLARLGDPGGLVERECERIAAVRGDAPPAPPEPSSGEGGLVARLRRREPKGRGPGRYWPVQHGSRASLDELLDGPLRGSAETARAGSARSGIDGADGGPAPAAGAGGGGGSADNGSGAAAAGAVGPAVPAPRPHWPSVVARRHKPADAAGADASPAASAPSEPAPAAAVPAVAGLAGGVPAETGPADGPAAGTAAAQAARKPRFQSWRSLRVALPDSIRGGPRLPASWPAAVRRWRKAAGPGLGSAARGLRTAWHAAVRKRPAGREGADRPPLVRVATWCRTRPLETAAVVLLGLGGVIFPPVFLIGALVALASGVWDYRDKWIGLALPVVLTVVALAVGIVIGGRAHGFHDGWMWAVMGSRIVALLGGMYLAWRAARGRRPPPVPPWSKPHKLA